MSVSMLSLHRCNVALYWAHVDNIFCERKVYVVVSTGAVVINFLAPPGLRLHLLASAFRESACALHAPFDLRSGAVVGPTMGRGP